jgi:hypothetical protein
LTGCRNNAKSTLPEHSTASIYPLQSAPSAGDTSMVAPGCDHTPAICNAKFNNLTKFRGFSYVPPPQMAI